MTTSDLRGVSKNNPAKPLPVAEPHDAGRAEGEETMASTSGCKLVGLGGWGGAQQPPSPFLPWLLPESQPKICWFRGRGGRQPAGGWAHGTSAGQQEWGA